MKSAQDNLSRLKKYIAQVIFGKSETINIAVTCLIAKSHLLKAYSPSF
jgi:hypothetical protein